MWFFFGAVVFWRPWHFSLPHRQLCLIRLKRHRISIMEAFQTLISLPLIAVDISRILRVFCQALTYLQFYVATFVWGAHSLDVGSLVKSIFLTSAGNSVGSSTGPHNQFLHTLIVKGSVSVFSLENIYTPSVDGALIYRGPGDARNESTVLHQPVLHSLVSGRKAGWSQAEVNFISCEHLSGRPSVGLALRVWRTSGLHVLCHFSSQGQCTVQKAPALTIASASCQRERKKTTQGTHPPLLGTFPEDALIYIPRLNLSLQPAAEGGLGYCLYTGQLWTQL